MSEQQKAYERILNSEKKAIEKAIAAINRSEVIQKNASRRSREK